MAWDRLHSVLSIGGGGGSRDSDEKSNACIIVVSMRISTWEENPDGWIRILNGFCSPGFPQRGWSFRVSVNDPVRSHQTPVYGTVDPESEGTTTTYLEGLRCAW